MEPEGQGCVEWVRAAVAGEAAAGKRLERELHPVIERSVRRVLRRTCRAGGYTADLVQEAWLFLLESGGRRLLAYDRGRGVSFAQYVSVLVARRTINLLVRCRAQK